MPVCSHIPAWKRICCSKQLFAVITGDCGNGKTTIICKFKDYLESAQFMVMYLADSQLTPRHFYKGTLEQLGCEAKFYRDDAKRQLHREIELMRAMHNLHPVVIVVEAHLLDKEMLEEVRFLLNFKMDAQSPMTLILVGQSELWGSVSFHIWTVLRWANTLEDILPMPVLTTICLRTLLLMRYRSFPAEQPDWLTRFALIVFYMVSRMEKRLSMIIL